MRIPKIELRYSRIYDDRYRRNEKIQKALEERGKEYPSAEEIVDFIKKVRTIWKRHEREILERISKITGLEWNENEIKCYIIGRGRSFSDPLTVRIYKEEADFVDTLTHELIHQISIQNKSKVKKWWDKITERFPNESRHTKIHLLVHAVHSVIYQNIFSKERMEKDINRAQKAPDYKKSWEIVTEEGADKIINEFREVAK